MTRRGWLWFALGAAVLGTVYFLADPMQSRWMPKCLFHAFTGWDCPGCGAQRMVHALLHGDLPGAWKANAMLLCLLPVIPFGIWADIRPGKIRNLFYHPATVWSIIALIILWGVARNL